MADPAQREEANAEPDRYRLDQFVPVKEAARTEPDRDWERDPAPALSPIAANKPRESVDESTWPASNRVEATEESRCSCGFHRPEPVHGDQPGDEG
jgi:hypothetical protein